MAGIVLVAIVMTRWTSWSMACKRSTCTIKPCYSCSWWTFKIIHSRTCIIRTIVPLDILNCIAVYVWWLVMISASHS